MSNYLYIECLDHDPTVQSPDEVGQKDYDLAVIVRLLSARSGLARLRALLREFEAEVQDSVRLAFENGYLHTAARFLEKHSGCRRIQVVDALGQVLFKPPSAEEDRLARFLGGVPAGDQAALRGAV